MRARGRTPRTFPYPYWIREFSQYLARSQARSIIMIFLNSAFFLMPPTPDGPHPDPTRVSGHEFTRAAKAAQKIKILAAEGRREAQRRNSTMSRRFPTRTAQPAFSYGLFTARATTLLSTGHPHVTGYDFSRTVPTNRKFHSLRRRPVAQRSGATQRTAAHACAAFAHSRTEFLA